ncbi:MAG: SELO family protein, partial [Campylobacterota bacterium]|nr:SELO family protein [Campylobacterota bacterium]
MTLNNLTLQTPYLNLDKEFYDLNDIQPLDEPYLISFNPKAAKLIDLDKETLHDPLFVELLNGNFTPKGSTSFSMC